MDGKPGEGAPLKEKEAFSKCLEAYIPVFLV